jgi:TolB-like protein
MLSQPKVGHRTILFPAAFLLAAFFSGCGFDRTDVPPANYYYLNPEKDLSVIGKVAFLELDNDSSYPQISAEVTEALFQALQKKQVFGLTAIRQKAPSWRSLQLDLDSTYTLEQLCQIRRSLGCDAVLTGTVTEYQPYPHMVIGLRLKLIDLTDGQLLWALEQIWDTADKVTERRIKSYFQRQMRSGFAPLREQLVTISSLKFIKFVVYEVAETFQSQDDDHGRIIFNVEGW